MKFLIDDNLSYRLVKKLKKQFPESKHVSDVGLDGADDLLIWRYAAEHGYVVLTQDGDFADLADIHGPPPKVVWVRIGNSKSTSVARLLKDNSEALLRFYSNKSNATLELGV